MKNFFNTYGYYYIDLIIVYFVSLLFKTIFI